MATQDLRVYSGKEILLAYYNRSFNKNIQLHEIQFGIPKRVATAGTNFNTTINLYPVLGTRYYGSPTINYDRVHISYLGTIVIAKGQATRIHDLLPAINAKYNINITEDDVHNDLLDPFNNGNITVNLRVKEESVMFYEGAIIYTPAYPDPSSAPLPQIDTYAFWSVTNSSSVVVLSNNNYTALMNNEHLAITQIPVSSGRAYWEVKVDTDALLIGVALPSAPRMITGGPVAGNNAQTWVLNTSNGKLYHNGAEFSYTDLQLVAGMTIGVLLDHSAGTLSFMVGNAVLGVAFTDLNLHSELYPIVAGATSANARGTANFGEFPFFYAPPVDYKRGVYTLLPTNTTAPPPASGGGGPASNQPAGTILSTLCMEEDKWHVIADGAGKFVFELVETESPDCGFDPNNPPVYSGGGSGGGGVGKPNLAALNGPFVMTENAPYSIEYRVSSPITSNVTINFAVEHVTTSAGDISGFEYRLQNEAGWTPINSGESFILTVGNNGFFIRVTPLADLTSEGNETFRMSFVENTIGEFLGNTQALVTNVVVTDTSVSNNKWLTVQSGAAQVNEGNFTDIQYTINPTSNQPITFKFDVNYQTASTADITVYQWKPHNSSTWVNIVPGDEFINPGSNAVFHIRVIANADALTEGDETLSVTIEEVPLNTQLSNIEPLAKLVTIKDTSLGGTYPDNPAPPAGFTGGESFSFQGNIVNQFELGESTNGSTITWQP